ncbi:HTH domain-containing protein [Salinigranum halophilum]|uniref:HTH domain-containing protein n=1 Tax=Salinigranum halophilum TaxID=2565931 RepID=UPI002AA2A2F4|nr:HTH domain-containing protein [Salinigranum halophilum]
MPAMTRPTVELWIRTLPTGEGEEHDELRRRLAALDRRGVVESVRVRTWPHEVVVDEPATARDSAIADRVREFRRWAARAGVALPAFDDRVTTGVGRMGPECTALRLPQTALAVRRGGRLQWVAPCVEDGVEHTPWEWVDAAAEGAAPGCEAGPVLIA